MAYRKFSVVTFILEAAVLLAIAVGTVIIMGRKEKTDSSYIGKGCRPALRAIFDAAALLLAGVTFVACSALFRFPALRLYMLAAAALGFWLYLKSLHRLLAFLAGKMYNTYRSGRRAKRAKPKRPSAYDERGKN